MTFSQDIVDDSVSEGPHTTVVLYDYKGTEKVPSPSDVVAQRITHVFAVMLV